MDAWQQLIDTFFTWSYLRQVLPDLITTGLVNTLILAVSAGVLGTVIGLPLALMAISRHWPQRLLARVYIDVFRGLPAAVTILLIGVGLATVARPLIGNNPYPLGILALGLIAGAYIAETFRSGIQSVDSGQLSAGRALGMGYLRAMWLVVIPQGVRRILPALVNQFIGLVKDSSLIYFLGLLASQRELFKIGQDAAAETGNLSPLVAAGLCYLIITVPLTHLVNQIDRRLAAGRRVQRAVSEESV